MDEHQKRIVEQFSLQALPFSKLAAHSNQEAMKLVASRCGLDGAQRLLDVACGPGLVALALAPACREVVGLDLTPAMLVRARELSAEQGVKNVAWVAGEMEHLPWEADSFDAVVTRFSLHHLLDPSKAIAEMLRVCKKGGRIAVVDVATSPASNDAYNRMEKLRDPSHTRALTLAELWALGAAARLEDLRLDQYGMDMDMEDQLSRSFPEPGDDGKLRELFHRDLGEQKLELQTRLEEGRIRYTYPVAQLSGRKLR